MNRRGFLKSLVAVSAAIAVPVGAFAQVSSSDISSRILWHWEFVDYNFSIRVVGELSGKAWGVHAPRVNGGGTHQFEATAEYYVMIEKAKDIIKAKLLALTA